MSDHVCQLDRSRSCEFLGDSTVGQPKSGKSEGGRNRDDGGADRPNVPTEQWFDEEEKETPKGG
jgi:hypothetical protein